MQAEVSYRGRVKYDENTASQYQERPHGQQVGEMAVLDRVFSGIDQEARVLDLPCGAGRASVHLAQRGYQVVCADLAPAMIALTRRALEANGLACPVEQQDIEAMSYGDRSFDAVLCFRLFHHFPDATIRQRAVAELCRVARRHVALSYFSPWSPASVRRRLRILLGGKRSEKYATPLGEVESYFAPHGFRLVQDFARNRLLHSLHVALFERIV